MYLTNIPLSEIDVISTMRVVFKKFELVDQKFVVGSYLSPCAKFTSKSYSAPRM